MNAQIIWEHAALWRSLASSHNSEMHDLWCVARDCRRSRSVRFFVERSTTPPTAVIDEPETVYCEACNLPLCYLPPPDTSIGSVQAINHAVAQALAATFPGRSTDES